MASSSFSSEIIKSSNIHCKIDTNSKLKKETMKPDTRIEENCNNTKKGGMFKGSNS